MSVDRLLGLRAPVRLLPLGAENEGPPSIPTSGETHGNSGYTATSSVHWWSTGPTSAIRPVVTPTHETETKYRTDSESPTPMKLQRFLSNWSISKIPSLG